MPRVFAEGRFVVAVTTPSPTETASPYPPNTIHVISTKEPRLVGSYTVPFGADALKIAIRKSGELLFVDEQANLRALDAAGRERFRVARPPGFGSAPDLRPLETGLWLLVSRERVALLDAGGAIVLSEAIRGDDDWAVSGDGERLALTAFEDGALRVKLFEARSGKQIASVPNDVGRLVYSANHRFLLGSRYCELVMLDGSSGLPLSRFGLRGPCSSSANVYGFTATGEVMVVRDEVLEVWAVSSKSLIAVARLPIVFRDTPPNAAPEASPFYFDERVLPLPQAPTHQVGYWYAPPRGSGGEGDAKYVLLPGVTSSISGPPAKTVAVDVSSRGHAYVPHRRRALVVRRKDDAPEVQTWDTERRELLKTVSVPPMQYEALVETSSRGDFALLRSSEAPASFFNVETGERVLALDTGHGVVGFRDDSAPMVMCEAAPR